MPATRLTGTPALTVLLCFLGALCEGFDVQAAGVAAAGLRHEFGPTAHELGIFFAASGAGLLLGAIAGGRLADRLGRKAVIVASLIAFGCFSFATCLAPSIPLLTVARFLTGLGLGGAMPNLIALAAEASSLRRRNASIASAYVGMPLGGLLASVVIYLIPLEKWRTVFQIGAFAPFFIAALFLAYLPKAVAVDVTPQRPPAGEGMLRVLFGERRTLRTLGLWAGFLLIVLVLHLMLNWLPLLLAGRGLSAALTALAQATFSVGGAASALWVGALLDSRWRRAGIVASVAALPLVLLAIAQLPPRPSIVLMLAALLGSAILGQQVILFAIASASYPQNKRGTGVGAAVGAGRVGSLIGPLLAGALLSAGRPSSEVFLSLLPVVLACGTCVLTLGWATRAAEHPEAPSPNDAAAHPAKAF